MKPLFLSFVLPAYNEEDSINELLQRVTSSMKSVDANYELIFVVEGEDMTIDRLCEFKVNNPEININIFYQKKPLGLTNAFKKGFNNVSQESTHVVTMDVDLNHNPEELPLLIEKAKQGYNLVIGSRALKGSRTLNVPPLKMLLSKFSNFIFNKAFDIAVKDKTGGFRMIDTATVKEIFPLLKSQGFEGLMEFLLLANRAKKTFAEVPITMRFRKHGKSKVKLWPVGKSYLKLLLRRNKIRRGK
jgi:dolichol-phosphate mannosyltransferase